MRPITLLFLVGEVSSLLFALAVTYFAYRAYWRSGSTAIRALMVGFGSLALGLVLGLGLVALVAGDPMLGLGVQSVLMALGFGFITYSLYVQDARLARAAVLPTSTRRAGWRRSDR